MFKASLAKEGKERQVGSQPAMHGLVSIMGREELDMCEGLGGLE